MKALAYIVVAVLLSSFADAELEGLADKDSYNLGDSIIASFVLSSNVSSSGLVELSLSCTDFGLKFYTAPVTLDSGSSFSASVPALRVSSRMLGRCFLAGSFSSFDGSLAFSNSSSEFNVTESIVIASSAPVKVKPNSKLPITLSFERSFDSPLTVSFTFLEESYRLPASGNSFSHSLDIPQYIKSGVHSLDFEANDSYGNRGIAALDFEVEAVPSKLDVALEENEALPGSRVRAEVTLLDQASDTMSGAVLLMIIDSTGKVLFEGQDNAPAGFAIDIALSMAPGVYTVSSTHENLSASSPLVVKPLRNVSVSFDSRHLNITNAGNVNYKDDFLILLNGSQVDFMLSEKVELAPEESVSVDLGNEVPEDDYEVSFPSVPQLDSFEAHVDDERGLLQKTGNLIGVTGKRTNKNPAPAIVLVAILAAAVFYVKRRFGSKGAKNLYP